MKKKLISLLLALCTLGTLVACGNNNTETPKNTEADTENNVENNVEDNLQNNEEDTKNNANYNSMLLDKYPNQKICEKDWTEMTFILNDKEYTLGNSLSNYNFEECGYIPTLSIPTSSTQISKITDTEKLNQTMVKKQETFYYCTNVNDLLEKFELNLINPTSEEIALYDCTVNGIGIGASLYTIGFTSDFSTFSINGLRLGDSEDTLLKTLGTNYATRKENKSGTVTYKYMNEDETKVLLMELDSNGIIYFYLAYKVDDLSLNNEEVNENITTETTEEEDLMSEEELTFEEEFVPNIMPSENWADMELVINGTLVNLEDLTYNQLTTLIGGRVSTNYEDNVLKAGKTSMMDVWLYEDSEDSLNVKFTNKTQEEILLTECNISSLEQTIRIKKESKDEIVFCKGLMPEQEMTTEQIIERFGEPAEISENTLIYKDATNKYFEITIKENIITSLKLYYK